MTLSSQWGLRKYLQQRVMVLDSLFPIKVRWPLNRALNERLSSTRPFSSNFKTATDSRSYLRQLLQSLRLLRSLREREAGEVMVASIGPEDY